MILFLIIWVFVYFELICLFGESSYSFPIQNLRAEQWFRSFIVPEFPMIKIWYRQLHKHVMISSIQIYTLTLRFVTHAFIPSLKVLLLQQILKMVTIFFCNENSLVTMQMSLWFFGGNFIKMHLESLQVPVPTYQEVSIESE